MDYSKLYSTAEALHARHAGAAKPLDRDVHLVHVVNPVDAPGESGLAKAQAATFESMRRAAAYSSLTDPQTRISLTATPMPEDTNAVPSDFIRLPDLDDVSSAHGNFDIERRLPILSEIVSRGVDYAQSDDRRSPNFIVLTNTDIGLMPHFYTYASWLIRCGHDVAIINRRGVVDSYQIPSDMPAILSDFGYVHPGLDCFIFDVRLVASFASSHSIIGMGFVMRSLLFNLIAHADNPVILTDAHATFHLGFDEAWRANKYHDYEHHNRNECIKVIEELSRRSPELEERLTRFAAATDEHRWLPEGLLGVSRGSTGKPPIHRRLRQRVAKRLIRLLQAAT
ncbi:MAG: hypothetical protein RIM84_25140 [Alphaproteobacteria bacterium]